MSIDTDGLHEIANTDNKDRRADIVFVHGLGGSSHSTWRHGSPEKADHFFWPEELGKDLPDCGIWTVGYPAGFTDLGPPGMIIEKRAGNLAQKFANARMGSRPIIFITHSMGGLIVKSLVVGSQVQADSDRKRIASAVQGIVFCGTPHSGSEFADVAAMLGVAQEHVAEMRSGKEALDILHDHFIEWHGSRKIPICSYAENIRLFGKKWFSRLPPFRKVVPRVSANPHIVGYTVRDVDEDHLTLVKPSSRKHDVYAGVLRFIQETLKSGVSSATSSAVGVAGKIVSVAKTGDTDELDSGKPDPIEFQVYREENWVGRTKLISELTGALTGSCRALLLLGIGGIGKTALAERLAKELQTWIPFEHDRFLRFNFYHDSLIPRREPDHSFVTTASLWLGQLGRLSHIPTERNNPDALIGTLVSALREERHLLLLDSIEYLLTSEGATGEMRFFESSWLRLIQQLLSSNTLPSHILLTTQDLPADLVELGGRFPARWRRQTLGGLTEDEQLTLFSKTSLIVDTASEAANVLRRIGKAYGGHPLALQTVIGEIREDYHGNVLSYWRAFGNQFERVEREIAQALAQGDVTTSSEHWNLDRFSGAVEREVGKWLARTFERLRANAPEAYRLLCFGATFVGPTPMSQWFEHLELMGSRLTAKEQQAAMQSLRDRRLVVNTFDNHNNPLLDMHGLIRSIALTHQKKLLQE